MKGDGNAQAEILVVGQNPGREEDKRGRPFIGASGKLIRAELVKAGFGTLLAEEKIRFTNIVRCLSPNNRPPTAKEIKACKPYMDAELKAVNPKYVLALGAPAAKALAKRSKITTAHGEFVDVDGRTVMAAYHPAFVLRSPDKLPALQNDLGRLRRHIDGTLGQKIADFKYRVVEIPADLPLFWKAFEEADFYSIDTETSGLLVQDPKFHIRCLIVHLPGCSWVIPLEMPHSVYAGDHHRAAAFLRVLQKKADGKTSYMWNGKYDNSALYAAYRVRFHLDFDAMLAHHLLDENQDHDLKYVSRVELDCPEYDIPKKSKINPDWSSDVDRRKYLEYGGHDGWNTTQLGLKFQRKLRANRQLRRLFYKLVMPAARALEEIEREGLTLDLEKYVSLEARVRLERQVAEATLNKQVGRTVNWNSSDQIAQVLFGDFKLPVMAQTPTGKPSTSETAIVDLKGKHPIINDLLKYRELDKILGTYLEGWKQYIVNGKLYLGYKQHGTVTGRFASRLHQIPTDGDIRSIVTAPPGWTFVGADLSQAELRIAAHRSGDLGLVETYRKGQDVHWETVLFMIAVGYMPEYAKQVIDTAYHLAPHTRGKPNLVDALGVLRTVGVDRCTTHWKGWKEARTRAKRVSFGFLYGMFENTFVKKAKVDYDWDCTWEQAHSFRQGFFEFRPGLLGWHENCRRLVRIDGYVTNMFGRIRRLPAIHSSDKGVRMEAERQAINAPVQGDIGDWKTAAMTEIHETVDRNTFRLVGEHHDALLGIVKTGWEDEALPQVRKIMKRPRLFDDFNINMKVPMEVDIALGPWGAGTPYTGDL